MVELEIHASVRKNFLRGNNSQNRRFMGSRFNNNLANYSNENCGYNVLNVIDTFSKYAWAKPLKKKNGIEVSKAFEEVIKNTIKIGQKSPNLLH